MAVGSGKMPVSYAFTWMCDMAGPAASIDNAVHVAGDTIASPTACVAGALAPSGPAGACLHGEVAIVHVDRAVEGALRAGRPV